MGLLEAMAQHLGLVVFTAIAIFLCGFLIYSMLHPERF